MNDLTGKGSGSYSIAVCFPCYNEAGNLHQTYESATAVLLKMGMDYEIVFVDDGSTDDTPKIADAIAAADSKVRVIHHVTNLGYGSALRSGFEAASKSLIFFTDGDGQFSLEELPPLIPLLNRYDIVSCFRLNRREGFIRRCNAWGWTGLMRLLFGLRVKDINCAFKLYKRCVFADMELRSTGALINAEILARATRRGFTITQAGVHHFPRTCGTPSGSSVSVIVCAFRELVKSYRDIKRDHRV